MTVVSEPSGSGPFRHSESVLRNDLPPAKPDFG